MRMDEDEFDKCKSTNRLPFQKDRVKGVTKSPHRLACSGRVLHDNLSMFV
jgi:hypothetical protein